MKTNDLTPLEVVRELNYKLHIRQEQEVNKTGIVHLLAFVTTGDVDVITFGDTVLWDSENDEREYIEESYVKEPLLPFIRKTFNNHISKLSKLKI